MLHYVADIFHKHILATWLEFEAESLTLSSLTVVLTVTDMANGHWLNVKRNVTHSKETCMVFTLCSFSSFHTFTFLTQFHTQLFKVNMLQVVFADLHGLKIYM